MRLVEPSSACEARCFRFFFAIFNQSSKRDSIDVAPELIIIGAIWYTLCVVRFVFGGEARKVKTMEIAIRHGHSSHSLRLRQWLLFLVVYNCSVVFVCSGEFCQAFDFSRGSSKSRIGSDSSGRIPTKCHTSHNDRKPTDSKAKTGSTNTENVQLIYLAES